MHYCDPIISDCLTMILSDSEMQYLLGKTTIHIEFPTHAIQASTSDRYEKSFAQILSMSSRDMAYGYRMGKKVASKAVKLHSKLIASVILSILANQEPGCLCTENQTLSWKCLKDEKLWLKMGIRLGAKQICRLDWVIHGLLVSNTDSVYRWIDSISQWEAFPVHDETLEFSELEYDSESKIITTVTGCADDRKLRKRRKLRKNCTLS